jgi:hypothetical protein
MGKRTTKTFIRNLKVGRSRNEWRRLCPMDISCPTCSKLDLDPSLLITLYSWAVLDILV